ncbi:unnamed protein product [Paramecium octaurelia]|uniref:Uncharacterized protein n=1 Tax=Paramecium octaurelia TaxID=43137 RepID=A0A8S1WDS6_PAROT|nr:unnamed protein product [Paramecium octaurelia]
MKYNDSCSDENRFKLDIQCSDKKSESYYCENRRTINRQLCQQKQQCYNCSYVCTVFYVEKQNYTFLPAAAIQDKEELCQEYSKSYRYDKPIHSCSDLNQQSVCNQSITVSGRQCEYHEQLNHCNECDQLTSNEKISELISYQWNQNCVLGAKGCILKLNFSIYDLPL